MDLGFLKNLIPFLGDKNKKPVTTPPFNPDIPASDPPPSTIVPAPIPVRTGTSAADGITPGEYAPIVPQMAQQQASPSQAPLTPVQETQARLQSIYDKRYNKGVWKNPDTGDTTSNPNKPGYTEMVTAPGKDRDPKWSTKDKIGSALLGAAKGFAMGGLPGAIAGGVMAGTDRNFMEKQHDQMQRARLIPQLQQQEEAQTFDQNARLKNAQIAIAEQKPEQTDRTLDLREYKILVDEAYKRDMVDLGREKADDNRRDRERIYELRKRGVDQNDARIKLLEEGIRSRERIAAQNNQTRRDVAASKEASITRRQQITLAAKQQADAVRSAEKALATARSAANKAQLQQQAQQAAAELARLKAELKSLNP